MNRLDVATVFAGDCGSDGGWSWSDFDSVLMMESDLIVSASDR